MSDVKIEIVLDINVIIHFIKGGYFSILHKIYSGYDYVVLSSVLDEEFKPEMEYRKILGRHIDNFNNIRIVEWLPSKECEISDYSELEKKFGAGESLSLVYCKYNNNVVASSNVRHIIKYCQENDIQYLTTADFLYHAMQVKLMTPEQCDEFIRDVNNNGSFIGINAMFEYRIRQILL